ncbi:hypothetical protein D3C81_2112840 [compost metagenome]
MPKVNGLANGLLRIVCICAPASDNAAPTATAINATGRRMSHITTRTCGEALSGENRAPSTSLKL